MIDNLKLAEWYEACLHGTKMWKKIVTECELMVSDDKIAELGEKVGVSMMIEKHDGKAKGGGSSAWTGKTAVMAEHPCPNCGSEVYDNRTDKRNPKAPDFKCKNKDSCRPDDSGIDEQSDDRQTGRGDQAGTT